MLNREGLFISECINLGFDLVFLLLFTYRFCTLRSFSFTDRYKSYFPKVRILFSLTYVVLSIALLVYNLAIRQYSSKDAYDYVLQGGGGQCIDSVILLIQLGVLRMELRKQQPYTFYHILYFFYLAVISVIRFGFMIYSIVEDTYRIVAVVLCCLFLVDSVGQLGYWLNKRQSLPQFREVTGKDISPIQEAPILRLDTQNSYWKINADHFPYIVPFVTINHGSIHITLQAANYDCEHSSQKGEQQENIQQSKKVTLLKKSNTTVAHTLQLLSSSDYSYEQLVKIYTECGRFPIEKAVQLQEDDLPKLAKEWQQFLEELFSQRRWYQPAVLKHFHINHPVVERYQHRLTHYTERQAAAQLDCSLGVPLGDDKNAVYCSVVVYKHLWVSDHYEFYLKSSLTYGDKSPSYPIKRYSEFEALHNNLKLACRALGKHISLPQLPPKHLFNWNQDQKTLTRRNALQKFIRNVANDPHLMGTPEFNKLILNFLNHPPGGQPEPAYPLDFYRGASVIKGEISKALLNNDYVTFYEFYLMNDGEQVQKINKRYSQFEQLQKELSRWMQNVQINYRAVNLPQKHYKKSEALRHQKLKNYLQNVIEIHDVEKLYAVNTFFNIFKNENSRFSDLSTIQQISKTSSKGSGQVKLSHIELQQSIRKQKSLSLSSKSSRQFSQIMNDLGNEELD